MLAKATFTKWMIASLAIFVSTSVFTYESTPPVGYTNAPGEGNCAACHTCTPISSGTAWGNITLARTGGSLNSITPNASNPMVLSFSSATSTKFGFQICVLPNSATSTSASIGTLNAGTSTLVQALSRIQAVITFRKLPLGLELAAVLPIGLLIGLHLLAILVEPLFMLL
jgi:hypothetical protein